MLFLAFIKRIKSMFGSLLGLLILVVSAGSAHTHFADSTYSRTEISQYGITWTFDQPVRVGRYITGDWWVKGPATIIKITPEPGPVSGYSQEFKVNRWNDTSLKPDTVMRNGSMIIEKVGAMQGYDSRAAGYSSQLSLCFPLTLSPNQSLISSISNDTLPVPNFAAPIMWDTEMMSETVMKAAAVLTCVAEIPPTDAFRPPYAGTDKPVLRASNIKWELLPQLHAVGEVPAWEVVERFFQRPWIDHLMSWSQQQLVPNENGPNYGREHARIVSLASMMLALDVPREKKDILTIGLIQRGIDIHGLAQVGGYWNEGGGHSSGRKWPVLFASLMLEEPALAELPETAFFQEDTQTYHGKGWAGQKVLWQMIQHHGKRDTFEEKDPSTWERWDKTSESYRTCCTAVSWVGSALLARYMKAIILWGHDAHFDYVDRWMREDDPYQSQRGDFPRPKGEGDTFDPFVTAMWKAHRAAAPEQKMSGVRRKFVWVGDKGGWEEQEGD